MTANNENQYGLGGTKRRKKVFNWYYLAFMLCLALASFSFATQKVAAYFSYHSALGKPLVSAFGMAWYVPWSILSWNAYGSDHEAVRRAVFHGQMLFIVPQLIILVFIMLGANKPKGRADLHGSAHWADENEIQATGLLGGKGIYLGGWVQQFSGFRGMARKLQGLATDVHRYLRHSGPEHVLLYAPTRSGKGVGVIVPTLLSYPESVLVLDIKKENWELTAGHRQSMGQKVLRFDPSDSSGTAACFNPLEEVRLDTLSAIPDVQNIATMIVDPEGKGLQDHWSKAGFAFIAGALLHCIVTVRHGQKRSATLHDLCNMLADENRSIEDLFQEMLETPHEEYVTKCFPSGATGGDQIHTFIASSAREMLNKAPNESSGVVSTALVNLALYRDPVVALNTRRSDFRIHDLLNYTDPVSLYLVVSPADINRLRPLLRLILNLAISRICASMDFANGEQIKPKRRLLMLLDEFTSIGKMEIINKSIAFAAGYGINYLLVIQDVEQLNETYGKANAIRGNCHIRVAYAPNTLETAKELSEMTGKTTIVDRKTSLSGSRSGLLKNTSLSVSETARPLLTPDECMRLPGLKKDAFGKAIEPGDMLIFVAGQAAIYGRQILYFLDPVFSKRAKIPAPKKSDSLSQESGNASPAAPVAPITPASAQEAEKPSEEQKTAGYKAYLAKQERPQ